MRPFPRRVPRRIAHPRGPGRLLDEFRSDARYAARALLRRRTFLAIAVTSLALAIALNTVMYSVLDALINPVVDIRHPDEVYWFFPQYNRRPPSGRSKVWSELPSLRGVDALSGWTWANSTDAMHETHATPAAVAIVRPNFFATLGMRPIAGRLFADRDVSSLGNPIIISDRLADHLYAPGENPIGTTIQLDHDRYTVIGEVRAQSVWPLPLNADVWRLPTIEQLTGMPVDMARIRPENLSAVRNQLAVLATRLAREAQLAPGDVQFRIVGVRPPPFRVTRFHVALTAAVLAILLIACANLANLQLARGLGRARELAMRAALGASRGRLIRHLVAESAVFAAAGLALGLLLTLWGVRLVSATIPEEVAQYVVRPRVSWHVVVFAAVAALACTLLVGLLPAIRVSRVDPNELLKSGAGTGAHRKNLRLYGTLIIAQIGFSLALLCGASAVVRSALHMADPNWVTQALFGYDPRPLISVTVKQKRLPGKTSEAQDAADIVAWLRSLPGVETATFAGHDTTAHRRITIVQDAGVQKEFLASNGPEVVSPTYFATMGLPIIRGRGFKPSEFDPHNVIIDSLTAEYFWPKANPIGRVLKYGDIASGVQWSRVIGVVGDLRNRARYGPDSLRPGPGIGGMYRVAVASDSLVATRDSVVRLDAIVRASGDAAGVALTIRQALRTSSTAALVDVRTYDETYRISWNRVARAFVAKLFIIFSSIGLALAAMGVYGIVAHSVVERRREIGVRIALGATARQVLEALLREGNVLALGGVALGLLFTKLTVSWLHAFLDDAEMYDAVLFACMGATLFVVTVVAALVPAHRATRIDPVEALRHE